jgi:hypothetical protein
MADALKSTQRPVRHPFVSPYFPSVSRYASGYPMLALDSRFDFSAEGFLPDLHSTMHGRV